MASPVSTNVNVNIQDPTKSDDDSSYSCNLSLENNSDDNDGSPLIGKTVKLRLFAGSDLTNTSIISTSGAVSIGGTGTATVGIDEDVFITLNGTRTASLPYPAIGPVTIEQRGTVYKKSGERYTGGLPEVSTSEIIVPENLYGVYKVSYTTKFQVVSFIPSEIGTAMIVVVSNCPDGNIVSTTSSVSVSENEGDTGEPTYSCGLSIEINEEDNNGVTSYEVGSNYRLRLFKGSDVGSVTAINSNGTISKTGSGLADVGVDEDLFISFEGSDTASLSYEISGSLTSTPVGSFYNLSGNGVSSPNLTVSGSEVSSPISIFGSYKASYTAAYDEYTFSINDEIPTIIGFSSSCGGEIVTASTSFEAVAAGYNDGSSSCCCSSCTSSSSVEILTDITLVYKDFITGNVLEGVQVSLDGKGLGTTDASGQIIAIGLKVGKQYSIKGMKEGYLNTDSDSFSNDAFIISAS